MQTIYQRGGGCMGMQAIISSEIADVRFVVLQQDTSGVGLESH